MKALTERILKLFFGIFLEEIFPQYNHPAGGKNLIQRKYCRQICLLPSLRCNKEATFVAFYSSGQTESRRFQIWQRTNIFHGKSIDIPLCLWQKLVLLLLLALHLTPSNTRVTSSSNLKLFLKHARPSLSQHFWFRFWRMYKLLRTLGSGSNESSRREHSIAPLKS